MAASPSGIITLLFILVIGPACVYLYTRFMDKCVRQHLKDAKKSISRHVSNVSDIVRRRSSTTDNERRPLQRDYSKSVMRLMEEVQVQDTRSTAAVLFGLIGYAVGLGNVYRFPFTIAANGGAAALIMYLICLVIVAYPAFAYEMVVGFFVGKPANEAWRAVRPRWIGLAFAQLVMMILQMGYFSVIAAYCLLYLVGSCQEPLPWSSEAQGTDTNAEASIKYWEKDVLNKFTNEELENRETGDLGGVQGHIVGALFVTWFIAFISMAFGKEIVHKITQFTVVVPVVLMAVMVATACTLPGASEGLKFYIGNFDGRAFGRIESWSACLGQVLFSLGPGYGIGLTYSASLDDPKINIMKTSAIVAGVNAGFSIFAGFYTFSVVGNLAYVTGESIEKITEEAGQGLAFVVAPVTMMQFGNAANVMSVLFFAMLFSLGIDTIFAFIEGIAAHVEGIFHLLKKEKLINRFRSITGTCVVLFLLALPYATRLAGEIMNTVGFFSDTLMLLMVCFFMMLAFNLDFKYERVDTTIKSTDHCLWKWYGRSTFHFFAPVGTLFLALYLFANTVQTPLFESPGLQSLNKWGWSLFALILATVLSTLWMRSPTQLPDIDAGIEVEASSKELETDQVGELDIEESESDKADKVITFADKEHVSVEDVLPVEEAL